VYPPGLPVARVEKVDRRVDAVFARIYCVPLPWCRAASHVLVLEPLSNHVPTRAQSSRQKSSQAQKHGEVCQAMIMRPGQQLLLPANPLFIWGSMVAAMLLNMCKTWACGDALPGVPDLLAVVLVFWTVHQPLRVGIGAAFVFGLVMDVHQGGCWGKTPWPIPC
jgi:hypothetical protein